MKFSNAATVRSYVWMLNGLDRRRRGLSRTQGKEETRAKSVEGELIDSNGCRFGSLADASLQIEGVRHAIEVQATDLRDVLAGAAGMLVRFQDCVSSRVVGLQALEFQ
jgi:hypothetical protein